MVEAADLVTAASAFIASRARTLHDRVEYVPDSVDRTHVHRTKVHDATAPLVAIWCGYSVKATELEPILPLLTERSIPLVVVSDARPEDGWQGRSGFVHRAVMQDFPDLSGQ